MTSKKDKIVQIGFGSDNKLYVLTQTGRIFMAVDGVETLGGQIVRKAGWGELTLPNFK